MKTYSIPFVFLSLLSVRTNDPEITNPRALAN